MKVTRRNPDQLRDSLHARCSVAGRPSELGEALMSYLNAMAAVVLMGERECPPTVPVMGSGGSAGLTSGGQNMRERVG